MNDDQILNLLQNSDKNAYKQLFLKYYSPLCEYASQYISDEDSEELVQDLMLFIWETRKSLIIETSLKSYLFISTKHRCLNAINKQLYHERIHNHIYDKLKDQFEDPDYYFINELTEHINKAIKELPDTYRDTFALSRFGELTNTQIATKLGVSVKTVEYMDGTAGIGPEEIDLIIDLCNGKDIPTDKRLALLKAIHHIKDTQIERSILESINGSDSRISKFLDEAEHLNKAVPDSN